MIVILKNTFRKLRNSSYWVKSGTLVLATRVSLMMLGFIGFLILIRSLNKDQFGIWVIFMTITSLIETVRIGFLKSPLMILNANKSIKKDQLYSTSIYLNLTITIITVIALMLVTSIWGQFFDIHIIRRLFILFYLKIFIVSVGDHLDLVQETNLDFRGTFLDLFSRNFVFVAFIVISFLLNFEITLDNLVLFQILGSSIGVILSLANAYTKRIKVLTIFKPKSSYFNMYFKLGKFTFGSSLISITFRNIDTWMLGALISPVAVAIYNPALRISNIFEIPTSTMSTILLPKLAKKVGSEGTKSIAYYYERSLIFILMFMVPVVIFSFLFSTNIISIVVGDGFEQSGELLRITIFFGLLIPFNRQFAIVMEAIGKPKISFLIMVCTLILSLSINYVLIRIYGVFGAAYGSLISYLLVFIFTQFYLNHLFGTKIMNIIKGVIPSFLRLFK